MGLQNYKPPRHEFDLGAENEPMSVRGLDLQSISVLIHHHLPDAEALFDLFANRVQLGTSDFQGLIMGIISDAPGFAANVIAMAADEPEAGPQVETMPFPLQVQIIEKIGELTFKDVGGLKKGLEKLMVLLNNDQIKEKVKATLKKAKPR